MSTSDRKLREALCPGCGRLNSGDAPFCTVCGAPLTTAATTDPLGSILAEGYAARRAATQSDKPIVLVGVWLWMVPLAVAGLAGLLLSVNELLKGSLFAGLLAGGFSLVFLYIAGAMLYRVTRNYLRQPGQRARDACKPLSSEGATEASSERLAADDERSDCLACGRPMSPSAVECAACGWSYSEDEPEVEH